MKLICIGHDYQYAVEQSLLALFPTERPEYGEDVISPNCAEIRLDETAPGVLAAKTTLTYDGKTGKATPQPILPPRPTLTNWKAPSSAV